MPCGSEDGKNTSDEMPYEMKLRKKGKFFPLFPFFLTAFL